MIALLALGYSINLLTLLALVLGIGLVVDDAIVVVENIHRHIEDGMTPFDAAIRGAHEIALPVVAMTITLAAVYAPIGFVSGVTGALFREFAFTLAGAVIVSGFIALTLSPMMCSKLLRHEHGAGRLRRVRRPDLRGAAARLPAPPVEHAELPRADAADPGRRAGDDRGHVPVDAARAGAGGGPGLPDRRWSRRRSTPTATTWSRRRSGSTARRSTVPELAHAFIVNGYPNVRAGFAGMLLKPWDQRTRSQKQVLAALGPKFLDVPEAQVQAFAPPSLPGSTGGAPMQFVIRTTGDYQTLADVALKMQQAARESGLFLFTDVDLKFDTPRIRRSASTPTRPTASASAWPTSAPRWRPCSAATTSTCSTSRDAAIR